MRFAATEFSKQKDGRHSLALYYMHNASIEGLTLSIQETTITWKIQWLLEKKMLPVCFCFVAPL